MDFIEKLLSSSRFDTILVIVNQLTKQAIFILAHDTITSTDLACLFVLHCYDSRLKVFKSRNNSCIGVTQENSIEFLVQSNLPYILIPMVRANYCALYPKWPWVIHEANMWYPCCMTSLCSRTFYFLLLRLVISLVTTPSSCDWCDSVTDNP